MTFELSYSSEMMPLPILPTAVFLGTGNSLPFQNSSQELFPPIAASMF